jgi:hypothetical protein
MKNDLIYLGIGALALYYFMNKANANVQTAQPQTQPSIIYTQTPTPTSEQKPSTEIIKVVERVSEKQPSIRYTEQTVRVGANTYVERDVNKSDYQKVLELAEQGITGPYYLDAHRYIWIPAKGSPAYNALLQEKDITILPVFEIK